MKSLILTLSFLLFCLTNVVAQATSYGNWRFVSGDENLFLYSLDGSGVENFYEIPDFTIIIKKNKGGDMRIRLDNKVLYEYDDSENDANYVSVDIIVDNNDIADVISGGSSEDAVKIHKINQSTDKIRQEEPRIVLEVKIF